MADPTSTKICAGCKLAKLMSEFFTNGKNPGHKARCKVCYVAQQASRLAAYGKARRAADPEENKSRCRAYRAANLEKERARRAAHWADPEKRALDIERQKRFKLENPERVKASQRRREAARAECRKAYIAKYAKANPDRYRVYQATRRARVRAAIGSHTPADVAAIRAMQRDCCAACRIKLNRRGALDHITSLAKGGSNDRSNLQFLCKPCNSAKRDKDPITFMRERGLLL